MRVLNNLRRSLRHRWFSFQGRLMYVAAFIWRRLLFRTTFIAITGSLGKTTCKECLAAILSSRFPTARSLANQNDWYGVPRSLLRVRPWHRFAVLEVAASSRGQMNRSAALVRPHIGVILNVARTHTQYFRTLENTAAEKAALLSALAPGGVAVLNGDDPRVRTMADGGSFPVRWFGSSPSFEVWAERVSSKWPDRLSFQAHAGTVSDQVRTQLVGVHLTASVLGSVAAAGVCGLGLSEAVEPLRRVEPQPARMQPVRLASGATFLRDDLNSSIDTVGVALRVLEESVATRKILVFSDMSDSRQSPRDRIARVGRESARIADVAIFVGDRAERGTRAAVAAGMPQENAHCFVSAEQAAEFLKTELRQEDLVLLKGRTSDHLSRIFLAQLGTVRCWRASCPTQKPCDTCAEL